ncbi:cobalamin-dependent protein [Nakamurella sp. PAMC28650]|jgi:DNA-binding transcriptional MerR regulator|uniref:MerR family transcriptional regulator n=1 Tax=Nakamurella sp. PAMC28650 TaxID=2762325 RepID=UPI00164EBF3B|nr:cobalamin-dependent protein [Nakamurella sp. PAMC28650]QNK82724.1 cobalamin B12-binding domain-containing protein [Nakamurella sp. PAMC28650]
MDSGAPTVARPADDARGVPIAEVSVILGVPMPTLRSWELRYGIPTLTRGSGRHRRYLPVEVHALRLMRDEIARGQQASLAAQSVREVLGIDGVAGALIHRILAASERLDAAAIRVLLDEASRTLGLMSCVDDVVMPSMRQIGVWWTVGQCDFDQERLTTEAIRGWLDRRSAFAPPPVRPQPILLACGPSDLHTIGLEAMAMVLREDGWACRVLGARTPTLTLAAATVATAALAVVVVSHLSTGRIRAIASMDAVRHLHVPVFYAGNAFTATRSRRGVPGTYLGSRIGGACELIAGALDGGRAKDLVLS